MRVFGMGVGRVVMVVMVVIVIVTVVMVVIMLILHHKTAHAGAERGAKFAIGHV